MKMRRVVVTGLGVVSPVGTGCQVFWQSLIQGKSGIGPLTALIVRRLIRVLPVK